MHPVSYLFEEIYRDWGITRADGPVRERGNAPGLATLPVRQTRAAVEIRDGWRDR